MLLNEQFVGEILLPLKVVWIRTRHEGLPKEWLAFSNEDLISCCIDRMPKYGYADTARLVHEAVTMHGKPTVQSFLSSHIQIA